MNETELNDAAAPRSVGQHQACSALVNALCVALPVCEERENGEEWRRGMVLTDAIQFKNTWHWRSGDPWLGSIDRLMVELAVPFEWVVWHDKERALLRIGNVRAALTYVQDSRFEAFALAWPNDSALPAEGREKP